MKSIARLEGIGQAYADKLAAVGIATVEDLLEKAGDRAARSRLAAESGISEKLVLKWVNMADLFRIKGIAAQYAELLERAGVDTVRELAQRDPVSLHARITDTNEKTRVVRQTPSLERLEAWIAEAKTLPVKVTH